MKQPFNHEKPQIDHNGRRFKSESLMCQYWGIDRKTYKYRRSKGLSIEESLIQELSQGKALKKPIEWPLDRLFFYKNK